jgi:hypothetical protein
MPARAAVARHTSHLAEKAVVPIPLEKEGINGTEGLEPDHLVLNRLVKNPELSPHRRIGSSLADVG